MKRCLRNSEAVQRSNVKVSFLAKLVQLNWTDVKHGSTLHLSPLANTVFKKVFQKSYNNDDGSNNDRIN